MRIRLKFTKQNKVKFVGHLDTVRLFQRAIKAAGIPIAYSQGYNPHSLVYFAMPLSVGVSSLSEYMDVITQEDVNIEEARQRLDAVLTEDICIVEALQIEEKAESLMSLVAAADYTLTIETKNLPKNFTFLCEQIMEEKELLITKKSKKKFKEVDIRPLIYTLEVEQLSNHYKMKVHLAAGSASNLSPELLLKAILGEGNLENIPYSIERTQLYALDETRHIPLSQLRR